MNSGLRVRPVLLIHGRSGSRREESRSKCSPHTCGMDTHAYLIIVGFYGFDVQFFLYLLCRLFSQQLYVHRTFSKQLKRAFISKYSITL